MPKSLSTLMHLRMKIQLRLVSYSSKMRALTCFGVVVLSIVIPGTHGTGEQPDQGFFMAVQFPAVDNRKRCEVYVYAISTEPLSEVETIDIMKDGQRVPEAAVTSRALTADGSVWGCYVSVAPPRGAFGSRFGRYTSVYTPETGAKESAYAFSRVNSRFLNTDGVHTVTVHPTAEGSSMLEATDPIGVRIVRGCTKYRWYKDGKRIRNTRPRLRITDIDDGGLYTIHRAGGSRRAKGWFAQILVIVASCPVDMYEGGGGNCMNGPTCENGGVVADKAFDCICNPFFGTFDCGCVVPQREDTPFTLADTRTGSELYCRDLPGGDEECKGLLVCYGDLYGCKCAPGWHGNNCDRACRKGKWGSNCELRCPSTESDCNRFFGPSTNLRSNGCS